MSTLPQTGATQLASGQAVPETSVNEMGYHLDAGHSRSIIEDRDLTAPPGSCADGARYLVAASPTGAWSGKAGKLAIAVGTNAASGWLFQTVAVEGFKLYVRDEDVELLYNGSSWVTTSTGGAATESLIVACSDETTALTAGTAKVTFRMPYAFTLTSVKASLTTAQATNGAGGIFTVDINEAGTTVLSTKLTIDNTEKTSATAATAAVISDSSLAADAEMTVDIDQIGDGTAAGLKITLIGHQ
jgi:hypothetical protein